MEGKTHGVPSLLEEGADKAKGLLSAAPAAMEVFNKTGLDTAAGSGGPAKQGAVAMQKGMAGAKAGGEIGQMVGGPAGKIVGQVAGATFGTIKGLVDQRKAMKEWHQNEKEQNFKENAFEKRKRAETYRMEEGLMAMEDLKALREKQLGIIS
jgi:hypothetical protein